MNKPNQTNSVMTDESKQNIPTPLDAESLLFYFERDMKNANKDSRSDDNNWYQNHAAAEKRRTEIRKGYQALLTRLQNLARLEAIDTVINRKAEQGMWQSYLEVMGDYKKELQALTKEEQVDE